MRRCKTCIASAEANGHGDAAPPQQPPAAAGAKAAGKKERPPPIDPVTYVCQTMEELLEKREFLLRFSPLLGCVAASRIVGKGMWPPALERSADHLGVARLLLDAGARHDARDVAGYTALHHALSVTWSDTSLAIAMLLLERGANIKAVTRGGRSVACDGLMNRDIVPARLSFEAGFDALDEELIVLKYFTVRSSAMLCLCSIAASHVRNN